MGYTREAAVRVSFLMAIPAVFGAGIWKPYRPSRTLPRGMPVCSPAGVLPSPQPSWHLWSLRGDHRLPEVCFHLLVQGIRHLRIGLAIVVALLLITGVLSPLEAAAAA